MVFADIHNHLLYGADDGAEDYAEMIKMADIAYEEGIRFLCATPHFCPTEFGNNSEISKTAFSELEKYCSEKYPDLKLILGNEAFYMEETLSWIKSGLCRTIGTTRYILVEFNMNEAERKIFENIYAIMTAGYVPILAHAERYSKVSMNLLRKFHEDGVLIQVNSDSFFCGLSFFRKIRLKMLLMEKIVDFVSTDAHSSQDRAPRMKKCYEHIVEKYGEEYANNICCKNAVNLFYADNSRRI